MPNTTLQSDGIWTWFNWPVAVYANSSIYVGSISANGGVQVSRYRAGSGRVMVQNEAPIFNVDDHSNPAVLQLANGKLLTAYSGHSGNNYSRLSSVGASHTAMTPAGTQIEAATASYSNLFQVADSAGTIYLFYRHDEASGQSWGFRTSTNGSTWSAYTQLWFVSGKRGYPQIRQTGANRIDFIFGQDSPNAVERINVYHFYMTVASDGTRSFFKSDGTSIGADAQLPVVPATATLVYDGSTTSSWVWDMAMISGTLTIAFATFSGASDLQAHYLRGRYTGGAWVTEEIANGGDVTPNYLFSGEDHYSGGVCLDPNDVNTAYVSRKYGAADFRIEKMVYSSGAWAKTVDVTGATGNGKINARPRYVLNAPTTQIIFWSATSYVDFSHYAADLLSYPDLPAVSTFTPAAKPSTPVWQPTKAPAGVNGYWPLHEGSGTTAHDLVPSGHNGTFVSTPAWAIASYGPQLGAFATTKYVAVDPATQLLATGSYPFWCAVLAVNSSASDGVSFSHGRSSSDNPNVAIRYNTNGTAQQISAFVRNDAGTNDQLAVNSIATNDGNYHVAMFVQWSATENALYFDGVQIGRQTVTTLGTTTFDRLTFGCLRRTSNALAFGGSIVAVACGSGDVPDPADVADDWLSGTFAAISPSITVYGANVPAAGDVIYIDFTTSDGNLVSGATATGITAKVNGVSATISSITQPSGRELQLNMAVPIRSGQTVTISIAGSNLVDEAGDTTADVTDFPVSNGSTYTVSTRRRQRRVIFLIRKRRRRHVRRR